MLTLLAVLALLIQLPFFGLMIFAPRHDLTRRVTSNYLVYVVLGILFIFLVIGLLTQLISLSGTVGSALSSIPTDPKTISADTQKPLTDALNTVSAALPTLLLVITSIGGIMDLAGGYIIYRETQRMGTRRVTAGILLFCMYFLSVIGMLIFALWHYLMQLRQATPVQPVAVSTVPSIPAPSAQSSSVQGPSVL